MRAKKQAQGQNVTYNILNFLFQGHVLSSVGAARKVSPYWSQETMTFRSSNCFSIVGGQGNAPLVTSLSSSCYMTPRFPLF